MGGLGGRSGIFSALKWSLSRFARRPYVFSYVSGGPLMALAGLP
jgi:hypothetical protein